MDKRREEGGGGGIGEIGVGGGGVNAAGKAVDRGVKSKVPRQLLTDNRAPAECRADDTGSRI